MTATQKWLITTCAAAAIALVGFGWKANGFVGDTLREILSEVGGVRNEVGGVRNAQSAASQELARLRDDVKTMADNQWTFTNQLLWVYEYKDMNPGAKVPIPDARSRARQ